MIFETPAKDRPTVRLALTQSTAGVQLNLRLSRGTIPVSPALCAGPPKGQSTTLTSFFTITSSTRGSVGNVVLATRSWRCLAVSKRPAVELRLP